MCRSKAQGGRRCPSKQGGGGGTSAFGEIVNSSSAVLDRTPATDSSVGQLNPQTPTYNTLLTTSAEEWLMKPWVERKQMSEKALGEVLKLTGSPARFNKWNKRTTSLGFAQFYLNLRTGEQFVEVELSDVVLRTAEPLTIADTIAHEVAHTLSHINEGHGMGWKSKFEEVKSQLGLNIETKSGHTSTDFELAAQMKLELERRAKAPWQGQCPQGHDFTAGRKPKYGHICVKCKQEGKPALITYERRNDTGRRS